MAAVDALAQGRDRARAAYRQAGNRNARLGEDRFEIARLRIAVEENRIGAVGVADVNWFGSTKTLDVHVGWLRRKLGEGPNHPTYIETVRGVGFRFAAPVAE